jgi:hypothetical protein
MAAQQSIAVTLTLKSASFRSTSCGGRSARIMDWLWLLAEFSPPAHFWSQFITGASVESKRPPARRT